MKKITVIICAFAAMLSVSCGQKVQKPVFNNQIDSVSYSFAMSRSNGFVEYLVNQMEVDTTYMKDFIKGFMAGASMDLGDQAKKAYMAGLEIGSSEVGNVMNQVNMQLFGEDSKEKLNKSNYISGFLSGATGDFSILSMDKANAMTDSIIELITARVTEEKFADNKAEGEAFMAEKAKQEGIHSLDCGVLYEIIKEGNGAIPTEEDNVKVKYEGSLIDGTVFDSNEDGIEFPVLGVIKGWQEVLKAMPVGSNWKVYIPQDLAYGAQDQGTIPPYSVLVFDMELLEIAK